MTSGKQPSVEELKKLFDVWKNGISDFGPGGSRGIMPSFEAEKAEHETGVLYYGNWHVEADGFSEHIRRCARALADAGVPVHLRGNSSTFAIGHSSTFAIGYSSVSPIQERDLKSELKDILRPSMSKYETRIFQMIASPNLFENICYLEYQKARGSITNEQLVAMNKLKIMSTVFERTPSEREKKALLNLGQVWVACQRNAEDLAGLPVHVVPVPYFLDDPLLELVSRPVTKKRVPVFYHIGKWEPRKEQTNILGAFMIAFRPGEASLILKTSKFCPPRLKNYPKTVEEAVGEWFKDERVERQGWNEQNFGQSVFIIRSVIPQKKIVELHAAGDVYVSLSRGEGFDMPARDAKLAGNLLVYTACGGTEDHAGEFDEEVRSSWATADCHEFYGWRDSKYGDYRVDDAAAAMRRAWEKIRRGVRGRGRSMQDQSAAYVGTTMRRLVEQLTGVTRWKS